MLIPQNTAVAIIVGPILDSTGAEYTSAVIGDLSISKNGGTLTALAESATLTHIANGQYTLTFTTGNTDTLGFAQVTCNKSTYQMPPLNVNVVTSEVYAILVTSGTIASATNITAGTITTVSGNVTGSVGSVTGLTASDVAAIKVATDRFLTMIVIDGAVYQYTANALELGPSGGGSATITVVPLTGVVEGRVDGTTINVFTQETCTISIAVVDAEGDAVTVAGLTLEIVIESRLTTDVVVIADGSITKSGSTISFAIPSAVSATEGAYQWALRKTTDDSVLLQGPLIVSYAPQGD